MLASVLKRKCGSICACSACMRASRTVRSSCSVCARLVASSAVNSARRLPPATTLMITEAMMSMTTGSGCFKMPPSISPRIDTSSSFFHETTASQSKKAHPMTTMPLRISRSACRASDRGFSGPRVPGSAAPGAGGLTGSVIIGEPSVACMRSAKLSERAIVPPAGSDTMQRDRGEVRESVASRRTECDLARLHASSWMPP